ncbi:MAG TPA: protein kinase [Blastocatellia bacterium]
MRPDRWKQVKRLYHAALEREPEARKAFLDEACAGDEDLRREVAELLACDVPSDSFIQSPAIEIAAREMAAEPLIEASNNPMGSLIVGSQIGAYRLLEPLGRGGMGEVHLALDTRLGRKVAVKLLLAEFTTDAERLRRFEQEARAASALNHPNIITVYEIGEIEGRRFIVTEYVEGETLRRLMAGAPQRRIRLSEALEIAAQVAAALQAAHESGITHRDIKPENVMLRADGLIKVLDFGLAKLSSARAGSQSAEAESLNTRSGTVMGTASYMSPEQARGEKVDHRTDIFSLGVMLYEMLAGRRPFEGETASDVMAVILTSEPVSLTEAAPDVPVTLWRIVQRCLEKRPGQRFQSAGDLGFALVAVSTLSDPRPVSRLDTLAAPAVTENVNTSSARKRERLAWLVAALLFGMVGYAWAYFTRQPVTDKGVLKAFIQPPEKSSFENIAVSPDGRHLAFTASTDSEVQLWVRAFNSTEARPIAGTRGAMLPFWSPDSRFIGFFADGRLKKVEMTGGLVKILGYAPSPLGGAWSRDGVILYGPHPVGGLWRVSERGEEVTTVITRDSSRQEIYLSHPSFLPDGRHFLYSITSGNKETRGVYLGSLDGPVKGPLLDQVTPIQYMAAVPGDTAGGPGWLVFGLDGKLLARPFDTNRLDFTGDPIVISEKVGSDPIDVTNITFSVSDNGVLVFDPSLNRQVSQYHWRDRRGQMLNSLNVPAGHYNVSLSPNEKRFIFDGRDPVTSTLELWLCDVSGRNASKFTINPAMDFYPVWSPKGDQIVWSSNRGGVILDLYQKTANIAGDDTPLLKSNSPKNPSDWSSDGRFIFYSQLDQKLKSDVYALPMNGSRTEGDPYPIVNTEASESGATLSPDGRWLAYASDLTERFEVYVQGFPGSGGKKQVSSGGGFGPRWGREGKELFYYAADGKLMVVPIRGIESFVTETAVPLFAFRAGTTPTLSGAPPYAVTRDGKRFLINTVVVTEPSAPLTVVVNWAADLKK